MRTDTNGASHILFIVRDDDGGSDLLFQTSDTTWQSYNFYGGYNAYTTGNPQGVGAEKLSYNRPFVTRGGELENWLFNAEYPTVRWLERNGYDVSYSTAVDTERRAGELLEHKAFLSVGHDEYWSQGRRDAVTAARNAGVNLAFLSGNEIYWKIRWEDSAIDGVTNDQRTQVVYKEGSAAPMGSAEHRDCYQDYECDPTSIWTGLWREASTLDPTATPENSLSGQISWRLNTGSITVPGEYAQMRFWRNSDVAALTPSGSVTLSYGTLGLRVGSLVRGIRRLLPGRAGPAVHDRCRVLRRTRATPPGHVPGTVRSAGVRRRHRAMGLGTRWYPRPRLRHPGPQRPTGHPEPPGRHERPAGDHC